MVTETRIYESQMTGKEGIDILKQDTVATRSLSLYYTRGKLSKVVMVEQLILGSAVQFPLFLSHPYNIYSEMQQLVHHE